MKIARRERCEHSAQVNNKEKDPPFMMIPVLFCILNDYTLDYISWVRFTRNG